LQVGRQQRTRQMNYESYSDTRAIVNVLEQKRREKEEREREREREREKAVMRREKLENSIPRKFMYIYKHVPHTAWEY